MATLGELGRLTDEESADLRDRAERFRSAWKADGSTRPEAYLPPRGSRHRPAALIQIVTIDMERRAAVGQPFRAERYVNTFPEELSTTEMPVELLAAEFRLRHRFTDKPALAEYKRWFPAQFDAMVAYLAEQAVGAEDATPVAGVNPGHDPGATPSEAAIGTLGDGRRVSNPPLIQTRLSGLAATGKVDVRAAAAANMNRSGIPSDMLPSDAPYQLLRKIGSGAFGEVFEALAPGGVKVAIKRILRSVDHPASISESEALEAIKGLSHPYLVKTNAYWVFDDKLVIVMELADGSLTDRMVFHQERGLPGVPPEELIPFFEEAGEALDYLHSQNISHRDVKPENLLLQKGHAKVADFGLARLHEHAMTMVGNTVGTPAYMAPEIWQQKLSLQSDQYSLAATYVRARLGRHLFNASALIDMAQCHIHETPNLDPLPKAEQAVLLRALAKKPDDRFPSCLEFAQALNAAVFPPPPPPKPEKRENRGMLIQAGVGAIATALAVGVVIWFMLLRGDQGRQENKNDEKPIVVVPPPPPPPITRCPNYKDWKAVEKDGTVLIGDMHYHKTLTRQVGKQVITAYLIEPTQNNDPSPFYMTEHKITNGVFKTVWDEHPAEVQELIEVSAGRNLVQGRWQKDKNHVIKIAQLFARTCFTDGLLLTIDNDCPVRDLPVMGVTLPEAILVGELLGGRLPSYKQWLKATGVKDAGVTTGPAGEELQLPTELNPKSPTAAVRAKQLEWKRQELRRRNLALGRERPLLVTDKTGWGDTSKWKIRQLVSNGQEWLGHNRAGVTIELSPPPDGEQYGLVVGRTARDVEIDSASLLKVKQPLPYEWTSTSGAATAGFRIVIEPK